MATAFFLDGLTGLSGDGIPAQLQHLVVATDEMDSMFQFL